MLGNNGGEEEAFLMPGDFWMGVWVARKPMGHLGGWAGTAGWCGDKAKIIIITAIMESLSCLSPPLSSLLTGQHHANLKSTSSVIYLV